MIMTVTVIVAAAVLPIAVAWVLRLALLRRHGSRMIGALREGRVLTYSFGLVALSILVGGAGGAVFGVVLAPRVADAVSQALGVAPSAWVAAAIAAPLTEEFGKGILLVGLFLFRRLRTTLDGLVLGLAAGLGFAAVENLVAFVVTLAESGPDEMLLAMRVRVALGAVIHGTCSAVFGAYLGAASADGRRWIVALAPSAALAVSSAIHGIWNGLLVTAEGRALPVVTALTVVLVAFAGVAVVARHELWRAGVAGSTWIPGRLHGPRGLKG